MRFSAVDPMVFQYSYDSVDMMIYGVIKAISTAAESRKNTPSITPNDLPRRDSRI
jgi:hypothetical protein